MTRDEFIKFAGVMFDGIIDLYKGKQQAYGASDDLFFNFRQTAARIYPELPMEAGMFKVAETLVDKHNVALAKGIDVSECSERLKDRIVYSLLQMAMVEEYHKPAPSLTTMVYPKNVLGGTLAAIRND